MAPVREAQIPAGAIRYRELGEGRPVVLVHGLLVGGSLWRKVAPLLAGELRVVVPELPLGAHELPLAPGTDLGPPGLAAIVADFLAALELEDVTLVGNDTGGAICQLVAVHHPERVGRLVLTPCDAYENFLPPAFRPLQWLARVPGAIAAIAQSLRPAPVRRSPLAFGLLAKHGIDDEVSEAWLRPLLADARVRDEVSSILRAIHPRHTLEAARRFGEFRAPVLVAWAPEDRFFKLRYGERLASDFPDARLELIADSYTFVAEDQPARTAELIGEFARR